jgi:hypothetical protein
VAFVRDSKSTAGGIGTFAGDILSEAQGRIEVCGYGGAVRCNACDYELGNGKK